MNTLVWLHIAGGSLAIVSGTAAAIARKGGALHARAGTWFVASMLVLGVTATILAHMERSVALGMGGILTCYLVATSRVTARRHDGATGTFEVVACTAMFGGAATLVWLGIAGIGSPDAGKPFFGAMLCLLFGALDLNAIRLVKLTAAQRLSRHLWRMCAAFFIATGSFFIGQQAVMPAAVRGSSVLFILGFAPLAVMLFWLVQIRSASARASARSGRPRATIIREHPALHR